MQPYSTECWLEDLSQWEAARMNRVKKKKTVLISSWHTKTQNTLKRANIFSKEADSPNPVDWPVGTCREGMKQRRPEKAEELASSAISQKCAL